jgi:hypothetical protein
VRRQAERGLQDGGARLLALLHLAGTLAQGFGSGTHAAWSVRNKTNDRSILTEFCPETRAFSVAFVTFFLGARA